VIELLRIIHSFIHQIFSTYSAPGIIPGTVSDREMKTDKTPALMEYVSGLKKIINKKKGKIMLHGDYVQRKKNKSGKKDGGFSKERGQKSWLSEEKHSEQRK